ncbi:uncharacterized protein BJ171DRAFT_438055 [Polychytrium aggregatum]|uniref:uncharacterized protein n=1 Tax=Polychytrium aggregatum TaxID=110093 RepID=UPI0022FDE572|nr:uncharacterized protein BJ171DRAFT_438055 [Polychytrium aggregatum]KAI9208539.1 hypothetical protein BJ171DRAFT_438055 [Polychytrium aggregatum]
MPPHFGQIVVGPPGSGKSTYCHGISQFYRAIERDVAIVNLDPANDGLPYEADIDIAELITLDDAMEVYGLGPNGAMIFCMEYLEKNIDWLVEKLQTLDGKYIIIDCPGQVEIFTNHPSMRNIIDVLSRQHDYRLCAVHLVDAHYCTDPAKYVAMLLLSLKAMMQLELPHVNILSKVDLMEAYGTLAFNLDYYTEVQDLSYLLQRLNTDNFGRKFTKLNEALCELIEEFSLVAFQTLCIEDKESVLKVVKHIDRANGYFHAGDEENLLETVMSVPVGSFLDEVAVVSEKYLDHAMTDAEGEDDIGVSTEYSDHVKDIIENEINPVFEGSQ